MPLAHASVSQLIGRNVHKCHDVLSCLVRLAFQACAVLGATGDTKFYAAQTFDALAQRSLGPWCFDILRSVAMLHLAMSAWLVVS